MKKRSWLAASAFIWCLAAAVAVASYSSRPPVSAAPPEHDHASHAGQPHVDEPPVEQAATSPSDEAAAPAEIEWEKDFESAMQRARTQGKPILIDFYADWCGPCKEMDARVYPDRQVIAQSQNWVTVKVDGEKRPDVMQAYGVSGYPTLLFAHPNGKPVASTTGYLDAPELVQTMQDAHAKWQNEHSQTRTS